jgi:heme/copper-type cytochrome/quinol oxidase subunit 2
VSEISHHEIADEAFHEIQLSGKQLVFLFMATTIVAVVIFLCGVQVGRFNDRREAEQVARRLEKEEQFKPWISH